MDTNRNLAPQPHDARNNIFAVILAMIMFGAGALLNTFDAQIIRATGMAVILGSVYALGLWFAWPYRRGRWAMALLAASLLFGVLSIVSFGGWYALYRESGQKPKNAEAAIGRTIPANKRRELSGILKLAPGTSYKIAIGYDKGCSDCESVAASLTDILSSVPGWSVVPHDLAVPFGASGIVVYYDARHSPAVAILSESLKGAQLGRGFDVVASYVDVIGESQAVAAIAVARADATLRPGTLSEPPTARFYSQRDKENLADLCTDLIGFLRDNGGDGGGTGLWKKLATLGNDWSFMRDGSGHDMAQMNRDLVEARAATRAFWDKMYEAGGFFRAHEAYHAELDSFFPPAQDFPGQIRALESAADNFGNAIAAVETEKGKTARKQLFMALEPSHEKYVRATQEFQRQLFDATQRVEKFRARL